MSKKLTTKELAFRTARMSGKNATEAAKAAGYKNPNKHAYRVDKKPAIRSFVEAKQQLAEQRAIADFNERQEFWSQTMRDKKIDLSDRHKASELLGKSQGDFIDRLKIEGDQQALLGLVTSILQSSIPVELWAQVSEKLTHAIDSMGLGSNSPVLS